MKAEELYKQGIEFLKSGERLRALGVFERACKLEPENPEFRSFLGLCIAYERRMMGEAVSHCEWALAAEPDNPDYYLNLGKVYLVFGSNSDAIRVLRNGMKVDNRNPYIIAELQEIGVRKKPVIPFLSRGHFLNRYIGIVLCRLGFR